MDGGISELAIASLALTAIGTGVAVAGSMAQASAAKKASEYNAGVAENNAKAAMDQANYQAQLTRERGLRVLGSQQAAYGKAGVDLTGSAADVGMDTSITNELDQLAAQYQGGVEANKYRAQAGLDRMSGQNAQSAAYWSAGSSLLTGASQGISNYDAAGKRGSSGNIPGYTSGDSYSKNSTPIF